MNSKINEKAWLFIGMVCMLLFLFLVFTKGFNTQDTLVMLIATFIAGIMYSFRRNSRIKKENNTNS